MLLAKFMKNTRERVYVLVKLQVLAGNVTKKESFYRYASMIPLSS